MIFNSVKNTLQSTKSFITKVIRMRAEFTILQQQAKEILYSNKPLPSNSDAQKADSDVQRAVTYCGVSPQCGDATRGNVASG